MVADTAFMTQFRSETVKAFEVNQSLLRQTATTEAVISGNTATFLVAGSGGARAVTRGVNGLIPSSDASLTQTSATLAEYHHLENATGFNVFASQGDRRRIMQENCAAVINREIDYNLLAVLETGTQDTGSAVTASLRLFTRAKAILGVAEVPMDGNIFCAITPAAEAYLMETKEFASADYVNNKPFAGGGLTTFRWAGVNFIVHPNLTGVGTSAEKCIMWHKSAIGHAMDTSGLKVGVGYDEEQDYSYARTSIYMGSALLQNSGVVIINHDGSALVAE